MILNDSIFVLTQIILFEILMVICLSQILDKGNELVENAWVTVRF